MAFAFDGNKGSLQASASATTIALTTSAAVTAGAEVFVAVSWTHATATCSLSGGGLTWTQRVAHVTATGSARIAIFTAPAPSGLASSTVLTATFSVTSPNRFIGCCASTGGVDSFGTPASRTAATAAWDAGAITTTQTNEFIFAACINWDDASSATPLTNYTEVHDVLSTRVFHSVYRIATPAGSFTPGGTYDSVPPSQGWAGVAVSQKETGGAAPKSQIRRQGPHGRGAPGLVVR